MQTDHPFLFISHAAVDKMSPVFISALERLHAEGIRMGIDRPRQLEIHGMTAEDFVWGMDGRGEDWQQAFFRAISNGACGIVVFASENTPETSAVWTEYTFVEGLNGLINIDLGFFLLALTPDAQKFVPERLRSRTFMRVEDELDGEIQRMRAHLEAARRQSDAGPPERRLARKAMGALIGKFRSIRLPLGAAVDLDAVFTPLRGDVLSSAERLAAYADQLDPGREMLGLQGPGTHDDKDMRLDAARIWGRNGAMPGTPMGLAATSDPWAVTGVSMTLAEAFRRHGRLVILGEPGAGKTTMLWWLALRFARIWEVLDDPGEKDFEVTALRRHVDPLARVAEEAGDGNGEPSRVSLGQPLLPVFVTLSDIAADMLQHGSGDLVPLLATRLAKMVDSIEFKDREELANKIVIDALGKGRLLVLLDGLDEIAEVGRKDALALIELFAETYTSVTPGPEPKRNNHLIVTSRIVGYHFLPLSADWPHVVVDRMTPAVVMEFWERLWKTFGLGDDPHERAAALHKEVYAPGRSGLVDLAGIPMLAALLARMFQKDGGLPERRAQIYERAIDYMVREQRAGNMEPKYVRDWLAPLAFDLHSSDGPSIIHQTQLVNQLKDRLKHIDPEITGEQVRYRMVTAFLKENEDNIGILIQRSEEYWAFIHRTFQEYLAGLWLEEQNLSGAVLARRLLAPRWREPALLLSGSSAYAGMDKGKVARRDALFESLLAVGGAPADRARIGRFLAEALEEMPDLPSDGVLVRVVRAAVSDLSASAWETLPDFVRARGISALYAFGRRDSGRLETALATLLIEGPSEVSRTVARIVMDRHWCTEALESALRRASEIHDLLDQDLPVTRALHQVVTEARHGELGASGKAAAWERQLEAHQKAVMAGHLYLVTGLDQKESVYDVLRRRADRGRLAFLSRLTPRDDRVDAALKGGAGLRPTTAGPEGADRSLATLGRDRFARFVVRAALERAFEYRGYAEASSEYRDLIKFIAMGSWAREVFLDLKPDLRIRFGMEDPIYSSAVHLDLYMEPLFKQFEPPLIETESTTIHPSATPSVRRHYEAESMFRIDWRTLFGRPHALGRHKAPTHRAQQVLAETLADLRGAIPVGRLISGLTEEERAATRHLLRVTLIVAKDAVARSGDHVVSRAAKATAREVAAVVQAMATTAQAVPFLPLRMPDDVQASSPRLFAERIAYRMTGLEANATRFAAATSLDAQTALPAPGALSVLQVLPETVTMLWARRIVGIETVAPWPIDLATGEITLAVFDMSSKFDVDGDLELRAAQTSTLFSRILAVPGSLAAASITPFAGLPRALLDWPIPLEQAAETVARAGDPYHDARFALGLFEARRSEDGLERAALLLPRIGSPAPRLDIAERLAKLAPETRAAPFRTNAIAAARSIDAPAQRWRALLRLAWQPGYPRATLLREVAAALNAIDDPEQAGWDLTAAMRLLAPWRRGAAEPALRRLSNRAIARSVRNGRLAPALLDLPGDSGDSAAILYIAQTCFDVLSALDELAERENTGTPIQAENPLWDGSAPPPDLTVALADRLVAMAADEAVAPPRDLPSVRHALAVRITCGFSLYACDRWLDRPAHPLAWIAALAIVRVRSRRDRRVLEPLLIAVRGNDEEFAAEAAMALTRGRLLCKRRAPDTALRDMGFDTLLWIGRRAINPEDLDLRSFLTCLVMDLYVPDGDLVKNLLKHAEKLPKEWPVVRFILEFLTWTAPEATEEMLRQLPGQRSDIQTSMILSLAAIDFTQRVDEKKKPEADPASPPPKIIRSFDSVRLATAIQKMTPTNETAPFRLFETGGKDLCALMARICVPELRREDRPRALEQELDEARIDVRDNLADPDKVFDALDAYLGSRSNAAGRALAFRHDRAACHDLRDKVGPDAVYLAADTLVRLTEIPDRDSEFVGLVAGMCLEFALVTPSILVTAFESRLGNSEAVMTFLAGLIANPPRGVSRATATAIACLLRRLDRNCVEALVAVSRRPDSGEWTLIDQSLSEVGRLDSTALPAIVEALESARPRTNLLAIRLLGILARDTIVDSEVRRRARGLLENYPADPRSARPIALFIPSTLDADDGHILHRGTLADAVRTELFLADEAQS